MKTLVLTLFLYFSLFATCAVWTGNNALTSNYPAPNGSYNKFFINPQAGPNGTNVTCNASNLGLLYMNANTLYLCANVNGSATAIVYNETCFNRFWNTGGAAAPNNCPAGYTQAASIVDSFTTASGPGGPSPGGAYTVYSTVCCINGSAVHP